jgi:hypothetical protein
MNNLSPNNVTRKCGCTTIETKEVRVDQSGTAVTTDWQDIQNIKGDM